MLHLSDGIHYLKILKRDGRDDLRIYHFSLFKEHVEFRVTRWLIRQSRIHRILKCKLNIMSEFLKSLPQLNRGNQVYSSSVAGKKKKKHPKF